MPRISKPTDLINPGGDEDTPIRWGDFVTDIIQGKYVLLVGSEVILKTEYSKGDSNRDILNSIVEDLKEVNALGPKFKCASFTELVRKSKRSDIRSLIVKSLMGEGYNYECSTDAVSDELKNLLRTKFFRIVLTTTFDTYLENTMREIYGNDLRVMSIYDEGRSFDFDGREQSSEEFDIRPTLYYICGKVNTKGKKFVATENDAIEVVARWLGDKAPANFLKNLRPKGLISIGCKFDDWLFRFIWYVLRRDVNHIDSMLKDAVAVSFTTESDRKLKEYLSSSNVYTEENARNFIKTILEHRDQCIRDIAEANRSKGGIFVSYAHEDMPIVAGIVDRLRREGFNVWFDSAKLEVGDDYDSRITEAIAQCKYFVPILSQQVKVDIINENTDRYYMATEWALAKQRAMNIGEHSGQGMHIMPLAINGYDETASYHKIFPFHGKTVVNLMQTPISRFIEEIKRHND